MEDNYISREGGKSKFSYFYIKKTNKKKIIDKKILDKISKIYKSQFLDSFYYF